MTRSQVENDIETIKESQIRLEMALKNHLENSVTMPQVEKEITTQIRHAVTQCKLDSKTNTKKITMRDAVFILGIIGVVAQNFI